MNNFDPATPNPFAQSPQNSATVTDTSDQATVDSVQFDDSYVNTYVPPTVQSDSAGMNSDMNGNSSMNAPTPAPMAAQSEPAASQTLEDQNIFELLGVADGSEEEKEAFLDELQQVIWEDFLENDVTLLLTEDEVANLRKIQASGSANDLEMQEAIVVYLEKLIPDLEEILLEKALELKEDMVKERIAGMREFYAQQPDKMSVIEQAQSAIADDRWRTAAELLNSIPA